VRAHDRAAAVSQREVARGGHARHNPPMNRPRGALAPGRLRVPEIITAYFWIIRALDRNG